MPLRRGQPQEYMKKAISFSLLSLIAIIGLFGVTNNESVSAANATTTCVNAVWRATLNGTVSPNGAETEAWFKWGVDRSVPWPTERQTFPADAPRTEYSYVLEPMAENTTYYFQAWASNEFGTVHGDIESFQTGTCNTPVQEKPEVNISADQTSVPFNGSTTIRWESENADSCSGTNGVNGKSGSMSTGNLTSSKTYTITCTNEAGSESDSVTVNVGQQPQELPSVSISANPTSVSFNGSTTITWSSSNATSCSNNWNSSTATGGFFTTNLTSTKTFTITCFNSAGQKSDSVTVNVGQQTQNPTVTISANPTSISFNGSTTITWNSTNATSCNATGPGSWSGSKGNSGSLTVSGLTSTSTFTITCQGASGTQPATDSVTVTVGTQTQNPTVTISANPSQVNPGGSSTITWTSSNATSCNATGGQNSWTGQKNTSGSFNTGALTNTTTFTITCSNSTGQASDSTTVNVGQQTQTPTVSITADQVGVPMNGSTTIRWTSTNATACSASGGQNGWSGTKNTSGSFFTGSLTSTKTFTITCTNSTGQASDSVTINVNGTTGDNDGPSVTISADDRTLDSDESTTVRWESDNADSCRGSGGANGWNNRSLPTSGFFHTGDLTSDKTFTITCEDDDGDEASDSVTIQVNDDNDNDNDDDEDVSVDISADDTSIDAGESTRVRWDSDNADSCEGSGGANGWNNEDLDDSGSFNTGRLYRDTTFRITCENDDDTASDSITIRVDDDNNDNDNDNNGNAPTAITTTAFNLTSNSAQLNSLIFSGGSSTSTWFEWGQTASLGSSTNRDSIGTATSTTHSETIFGLSPNRTYYYRAVAENNFGRSNGAILSFTTTSGFTGGGGGGGGGSNTVIIRERAASNQVVQFVGGGGSNPLVMLTIDGGAEIITAGDSRYYHVTWQNISNQVLTDVFLRVLLPQTMLFQGATKGAFSAADNSLNLDIGTLYPGQGDDLYLVASAKPGTRDGEMIVVTANLVYTDQAGIQDNALAYATHRYTTAAAVLGASVFGAGTFLPTSLLGWLILLLLLILLAWLIGRLLNDRPTTVTHIEEIHRPL